ncbi:MAG: pantetheine-phosphate adenylyltransferase [Dysgonamonadaceae bacterium]|jgi:pantetheine-phosphate adenylyltransferase|nr:pantetheine-phosphate adenylyltransferase [Dysgonamonadaceae bacterium]
MNNPKKIALFPGTFDPFTLGHLSIVERGLNFADEVIIAIGINLDKKTLFTPEQRHEMVARLFASNNRVKVVTYKGLTVDVAKSENASFILRGLRSFTDFEYERSIAEVNRKIAGIETVFLFTEPEYAHISSSTVRELLEWKRPADDLVPADLHINDYIKQLKINLK